MTAFTLASAARSDEPVYTPLGREGGEGPYKPAIAGTTSPSMGNGVGMGRPPVQLGPREPKFYAHTAAKTPRQARERPAVMAIRHPNRASERRRSPRAAWPRSTFGLNHCVQVCSGQCSQHCPG